MFFYCEIFEGTCSGKLTFEVALGQSYYIFWNKQMDVFSMGLNCHHSSIEGCSGELYCSHNATSGGSGAGE